MGGSIVTAGGLVFIAATNDRRFRAFDKETGKELWVTKLEATGHATPMTFMGPKTHKQFVVIAAGGGGRYNKSHSDALVAFALPAEVQGASPGLLETTKARVISSGPGHEPDEIKVPAKPLVQPIPFSHRQHVQVGLECNACHPAEGTGELVHMPEAVECLNCHQTIQKDRPSIQKLVAFQKKNKPVPWVRIYKLPDFVFFSHQKHADAKVECETCHGSVRTRHILWQEKDISMNACVDCHKARSASIDCNLCHAGMER